MHDHHQREAGRRAGRGTGLGSGRGEARHKAVHVAVVGGGIAGLSAALALRELAGDRVHVTVLEQAPQVGGKLRVAEIDGLTVDDGAESMLARRPEGVELARAAGLGAELVHPATTAAAVWSRGALRPLPIGTVLGIPADLHALARSGLLNLAELGRVPLDRWLPGAPLQDDVAVGRLVRDRLGAGVVDRLVEPLLGGVYAGHADAISLEMAVPALYAALRDGERSLLAAAAAVRAQSTAGPPGASGSPGASDPDPVFASLRGGLGRLPRAVAEASGAEIRTGSTVRALRRTPKGWRLVLGPTRRPETLHVDAVVLAVPARPAARLLAAVAPLAATELDRVDYASVGLVTLLWPRAAFPAAPRGSGFLVPPVENRTIKAVTFTTTKWEWAARAAGGRVVVRLSAGRHGEERDLQRDDADLVAVAVRELADATGVRGAPLASRVTRWGGGLPQYAPGHRGLVGRVRAGLAAQPRLAVAGAAYDGVGVPACVASGRAAAARVVAELGAEGQ